MSTTSPTAEKRWVSLLLRQRRQAVGLTIAQVAALLPGITAASLTKWETRERMPSDQAARQLLGFYNERTSGTPVDVELVLGHLAVARRPVTGKAWPHDPDGFRTFVDLRAGAAHIEQYTVTALPGLLQTYRYAYDVISRGAVELTDREIEARAEARVAHAQILTRPDPVTLTAFFPEFVLDHVRDPGQLQHLLDLAERPNVLLRIIPRDTLPHSAHHGPFTKLTFAGDSADSGGVVCVENRLEIRQYDEPEQLRAYHAVLSDLRRTAVPHAQSVQIITSIAARRPRV